MLIGVSYFASNKKNYFSERCPLSLNFNSILRRDLQKKNSYERRAYESVDEKSLSMALSRKNDEKRIWSIKG